MGIICGLTSCSCMEYDSHACDIACCPLYIPPYILLLLCMLSLYVFWQTYKHIKEMIKND